jgi:hypothetical protein
VKILAILLVLLNAALLVPAAEPYFQLLAIVAVLVAVALVVLSVLAKPTASVVTAKPAAAEAVKPPAAAPVQQNQGQAEVVTLLGVFQEKGRLIDFLMEDITPYSDAEVGSVARAVHQGCKAALHDHFQIEPVSTVGEGSTLTVPTGAAADEFRLLGNLAGEAPFAGKLVHKGWRTTAVKLPRQINGGDGRIPVIAPAQVEIA